MMAELQRILSENPDALKGDDALSMASLFTAYEGAVNGTLFEELGRWFDLTGKVRVYDGFFRGKEEDDFRVSHYLDVAGLRSTMRELQEPLMDERLPKPFRDGVSYITDTDMHHICNRYGIPIMPKANQATDQPHNKDGPGTK
jgi:hypothetical protein